VIKTLIYIHADASFLLGEKKMKKISRYEIRNLINEAILNEDSEANLLDKAKYRVRGAVDKIKDRINPVDGRHGDHLIDDEDMIEETREEYVKRILMEYDYRLGTEGKIIATSSPASGNNQTFVYRVVDDGNMQLYVRKQGSGDFAKLDFALTSGVFGRGLGKSREDEAIITKFILDMFRKLGGTPASSIDQTADQDVALNESLSRGNLYRRRYHGRY
jgi:hypothetical protein